MPSITKKHKIKFVTYQVTDDDLNDQSPSLNNGIVAFAKRARPKNWEIFYWNGNIFRQISKDPNKTNLKPSLFSGQIAWHSYDQSLDKNTIYLWNGADTVQIVSNGMGITSPSLYLGKIAFVKELRSADGHVTPQIYYWNGTETIQITHNEDGLKHDSPSLYEDTIAWQGEISKGGVWGIYYWDGNTISLISDNGRHPSLYNGTIAWQAYDGNDEEIYYFNGKNIVRVTYNDIEDVFPSLYDGKIAWEGYDGHDREIFFWDGNQVTKVTDNDIDDSSPSLHGTQIAYSGFDGNDYEIYLASYGESLVYAPDLYAKYKSFHTKDFGKKISASFQIENIGRYDSSAFTIGIYLSDNGSELKEPPLDKRFINDGLMVGRSKVETLAYASKESLSGKYLVFVIDSEKEVNEINEGNNWIVTQIP
jgi:hypothetical protein